MAPLRLYADENISASVVRAMRQEGHDVFWAKIDAPGLDDPDHLALAVRSGRVLITHDTDFGALIHLEGRNAICGVVLCRFRDDMLREERAERVVEILRDHGEELENKLTVVTRLLLRITDLPDRG